MKSSLLVFAAFSMMGVAACSEDGRYATPVGTGGAGGSGGALPGGANGMGGTVLANGGSAGTLVTTSGGASSGGSANGGRSGASGTGGSGGGAGSGGASSGGSTGTGGAPPVPPSGPVITTKSGKVQGYVKGGTNAFLGIPYAAPPTGDRRFAPPSAPAPWGEVRTVTAFGAVCPQRKSPTAIFSPNPPPQNEDCLTLNVYTPAVKVTKAPVIVYFHPGGFNGGTSGDYDGSALSEAGNAVVITADYRLGALGFLLNAELDKALGGPSGNMGLRDQQFVLAWVKDNVAEFGGDPDNVTLLGESCLHVFAAGSRKLANRFVVDGPSCVSNPVGSLVRSSVQWLSDKLVTQLCPDAPDSVACLRGLPADKIANFVNNDNTDPGPDPLGQGFRPQVDGTTLQDYPKALLASGDFHQGPILTGADAKAATITRLDPSTTKDLMTKLNFGFYAIFTYITQWSTLQPLYAPATDADAVDSFERLSTDTWFRCPIRALARGAAAKGRNVYFYSFDLAPAVSGQDLDYVFGTPVESPAMKSPPFSTAAPNPLVPELVRATQSYLIGFAKTGNPNQGSSLQWPTYTSDSYEHLSLNNPIAVATAFSQKECDTWDTANTASPY